MVRQASVAMLDNFPVLAFYMREIAIFVSVN